MLNTNISLYNPPSELPTLPIAPDAAIATRRACMQDVPRLYTMINHYAARDDMLPRSLDYLYNRLREFYVAEAGGEVIGCAGLKIIWENLAEVVSVVVHPDVQGRAVGRTLVETLFVEAVELGITTIYTFTLQPVFFSRLGFREVPRLSMPHKIWQECNMCPKQHRCDEITMMREVS
jgi:amino-acid N-acetyltransferase